MKTFSTLGISIQLQDYFEQLKSMPDDPEYSIPIGAQTSGFDSFLMITLKPSQYMMPVLHPEKLIDDIRYNQMQENQGIIKVENGKTKNGFYYIYSIIKSMNSEQGMEYIFSMDIPVHPEFCLNIHGSFIEKGVIGERDTTIFEFALRDGKIKFNDNTNSYDGWFEDPYDENWTKGIPMNLSENSGFDDMFPEHPLTHVRILVDNIKSTFDIQSSK